MATQIMSDAELEKLRGFPEISREELVHYFTLTPADEGFLAGHRRPGNVLGLAVQLSAPLLAEPEEDDGRVRHPAGTETHRRAAIGNVWSTSRNELWEKGATSGESFEVVEVRVNCEQNSFVYLVRPRRGGICHTRNQKGRPRNCFYRRIDLQSMRLEKAPIYYPRYETARHHR